MALVVPVVDVDVDVGLSVCSGCSIVESVACRIKGNYLLSCFSISITVSSIASLTSFDK